MDTRSKRFPICGILSLAAGVTSWMLFCWMFNPPAFMQKDQTGHGLFFCEMGMLAGVAVAFILGMLALVRREKFSAAALGSAVLVAVAVLGLIILAMLLLSRHMMGQ